MAERKVTSKYFPPDFDPRAIEGRVKKPKTHGLKSIPIRLMAPFSMKCTNCGEYIYKGRKFNARKETTDEKYLGITLFRFYIKCTDCKHEIIFRTDPKNKDYKCEKGAQRNYEAWRDNDEDKYKDETQEETLARLERELGEEEAQQERDKMAELEDKMKESKREMQVADALDEIRTRNARIERNEATGAKAAIGEPVSAIDDENARFEAEIAEIARKRFRDADGNPKPRPSGTYQGVISKEQLLKNLKERLGIDSLDDAPRDENGDIIIPSTDEEQAKASERLKEEDKEELQELRIKAKNPDLFKGLEDFMDMDKKRISQMIKEKKRKRAERRLERAVHQAALDKRTSEKASDKKPSE